MNILVESLKRLYRNEKITIDKLQEMLVNKSIKKEEFEYIVNN